MTRATGVGSHPGEDQRAFEEAVRLPEVGVTVGSRTAMTDADGRFEVRELPAGSPRAKA